MYFARQLQASYLYFCVVVDNVLAKKHVLSGCQLQVKPLQEDAMVYELNKLKITMSSSIPNAEQYLCLFFGSVGLEESDFTLTFAENSCLVVFNKDYTLKGMVLANLYSL